MKILYSTKVTKNINKPESKYSNNRIVRSQTIYNRHTLKLPRVKATNFKFTKAVSQKLIITTFPITKNLTKLKLAKH